LHAGERKPSRYQKSPKSFEGTFTRKIRAVVFNGRGDDNAETVLRAFKQWKGSYVVYFEKSYPEKREAH
jgi:hypothetical protein